VTATDAPTTTNGAQAELVYRYADDAGTLRYEVIRRPPKKFLQRRPDPTGKNGWTWDLDNVTRIPYRLVNLTIAAENGLTAWVVEGEKDVERLIGLGLTATTNAGGAKWPWPDEWAEHFRGLHQAIVIADNDDPGRTAALQRAKVIARTVPDVRIIEQLPGVPAKGDVTDWLNAGGTLEELAELAERAPTITDLADTEDDDLSYLDRLRQQLLVGDAIMNLPPPKPLIDGLLDQNSLAALYGRAGSFKSFVAIDWALSVSTGSWWFGQQVVKGRVLYVVAEGAVGVPQRVDAWKHARRTWSLGDIIWLPVPVDIFHAGHALDVARLARELNPTLIVIDTLARSVPTADENSAKDMGQVVLNADRLRRATGACVLVVHHTGRDEARGMRGSTVLEGAMDTTLECRKNEDGAVEITSTKQKNSQSGQRLRFAMAKERDSLVLAEWRGDQTDEIGVTAEAMLTTLHEIDTGEGVTATIWLETSGQPKKTFYRWRKKLLDLDLVSSQGAGNQKRFSVTEEGLVAIGVVEMELPEQF
jgi:hypothetical protein